jgi:hypothetical protein
VKFTVQEMFMASLQQAEFEEVTLSANSAILPVSLGEREEYFLGGAL